MSYFLQCGTFVCLQSLQCFAVLADDHAWLNTEPKFTAYRNINMFSIFALLSIISTYTTDTTTTYSFIITTGGLHTMNVCETERLVAQIGSSCGDAAMATYHSLGVATTIGKGDINGRRCRQDRCQNSRVKTREF